MKKRKEDTWGVLICATAWEETPGWLNKATQWEFVPFNKRVEGGFYNTNTGTFVSEEIVIALYLREISSQEEAEFIAQNAHLNFKPDPDIFKV